MTEPKKLIGTFGLEYARPLLLEPTGILSPRKLKLADTGLSDLPTGSTPATPPPEKEPIDPVGSLSIPTDKLDKGAVPATLIWYVKTI